MIYKDFNEISEELKEDIFKEFFFGLSYFEISKYREKLNDQYIDFRDNYPLVCFANDMIENPKISETKNLVEELDEILEQITEIDLLKAKRYLNKNKDDR